MLEATTYRSKFFKAESRIAEENAACQSYATVLSDAFFIKDTYLPAGSSVDVTLAKGLHNIIFPIVGALVLAVDDGAEVIVAPGELYYIKDNGSGTIRVQNPFEEERINFLQLGTDKGIDPSVVATQPVAQLDITVKNRLISGSGFAGNLQVGVYDSRKKDIVKLQGENSSVFVYIINGSFEVEERLMEHRDGLFLWDVAEADFEALSETAIILFIGYSTT